MRHALAILGVLAAGLVHADEVPIPTSTTPLAPLMPLTPPVASPPPAPPPPANPAASTRIAPAGFTTPPLVLPPIERLGYDLPSGKTVSRPLQPIQLAEPEKPTSAPSSEEGATETLTGDPRPSGPLPRSWDNYELLFWWQKAQPVPPLVTGSAALQPPILNSTGSTLLVGGRSLNNQESAGGRFTWGWAINPDATIGIEATYLFLGTRTYQQGYSSFTAPLVPTLGRPFINARTGQEDVVLVSYPGASAGMVVASYSSRVSGWEVGGVFNVHDSSEWKVNATVGYRYFMLNEGLRIEQNSLQFATTTAPAILATTADQIDAHNRFHGGQFGLTAKLNRRQVFLELVGKVALGQSNQIVQVDGQGLTFVPGTVPILQPTVGGMLGVNSNIGRETKGSFAVLPEATVRVGFHMTEGSLFYLGYSMIYVNEIARAGDQVNRVIDPAQIGLRSGQLPPMAAQPGGIAIRSSDMWLQGLMFGFEYRY